MITIVVAVASLWSGSYTGSYRAGFVNPKPISVEIGVDGTGHTSNGLHGDVLPDGSFVFRSRLERWTGRFYWRGDALVGDFQALHPLVRGTMWLNRR